MNIIAYLMLGLMTLAAWLAGSPKSRSKISARLQGIPAGALFASNEGTHEHGRITRTADAALSVENLLVKVGTDADHSAVCAQADIPLGTVADTPAAGDINAIEMLGKGRSKTMVASGVIAAGIEVFTNASGKVGSRALTSGACWFVGIALTAAAADGDEIEVNDCAPVKTTI